MASRLRQLYPILRQCAQQSFTPSQSCTSSTSGEGIQVTPEVSLFDQKVHIRVQGLPSNAKVTLFATTQQVWQKKPVEFVSCSQHITSNSGELDLNRDASIGGTYTGLDPMGLFWSLRPSPAGPQNIRMVVRNGDDPVQYTLSVYHGHLSLNDLVSSDTAHKPVYSRSVTRLKRSADVRRIPVKEGTVRGILFLPPGEGPHPGVIDMFGSSGGLMELRASLLASKGFAVLALAIFKYEDLPSTLEEVTFDYFEEAASWLTSQKAVKDGGIGIVGVSAGAQFALLMAWLCPEVKAIVQINGPPFLYQYDMNRKDGTLVQEAIKVDLALADQTEHGLVIKDSFPCIKEKFIPVWESSSHVLTFVSDDDKQANPEYGYFFYSLFPEDKRHLVELVRYPGAGHLLEPPYNPHCLSCQNPAYGMDFMWGGNPVDHAVAQEDSWRRIVNFLKTHLS